MSEKDDMIWQTARRTLSIEAEALVYLLDCLDQSAFLKCVQTIFDAKGRVVVTGIGKSAIVAQKIAATFNSTGTPALFMHAADAIHGDLGMVGPNDVVLCLSKSGSSAEIRVLAPLLRRFGAPLIALTSNASSPLALSADILLLAPVSREADPDDLAPTASTTVQMALGDALATALLAKRGFSKDDFAQLHPGGSLGARLYLKVGDLSQKNQRPAVGPGASISEVILEITSKRLGATAVLGDRGELLGIITDGDLRRMLEKHSDIGHLKASDILHPSPQTIDAGAMAVEALSIIQNKKITQIIALDNGAYAGMLHLHDLVREGIV